MMRVGGEFVDAVPTLDRPQCGGPTGHPPLEHRAFFWGLHPTGGVDGSQPESGTIHRRRAAIAVAPFLALGLADVILLLVGGVEPLWGFMILPPILFMSVLAWFAFRTNLDRDHAG